MSINDIIQDFDDSQTTIGIGKGTITTVAPLGKTPMAGVNTPNLPAFTQAAIDRGLMPQTCDWWTSLLWKKNSYSSQVVAPPLSFVAVTNGLKMGYPTTLSVGTPRTPDPDHFFQGYSYNIANYDLCVGVEGLASPDTKVDDYSDWSVTAAWSNGPQQQGLLATITKGSPFVFFKVTGGRACVQTIGQSMTISQAGNLLALAVNNHSYALFAPSGSIWTYDKDKHTYYSNLNGKDYLSIAVLPDATPARLDFFRRRAYAFVKKTSVSYTYDEPAAKVRAVYQVDTELVEQGADLLNQTVLALFRHQWLYVDPSTLLDFTYSSPRSTMKVVDGNRFETAVDHYGILPSLPLVAVDGPGGFAEADLYNLVDLSMKSIQRKQIDSSGHTLDPVWKGFVGDDAETYFGAKPLLRLAKLIEVAYAVGHTTAFAFFLDYLKSILEYRFGGAGKQTFYYDRTWKTLIGYPSSFGSDQGNDHHFHYGYFLQVAATIARFDPAWAAPDQWGGMINLLIRDANGPSRNDPKFPFLRCFEVYEGHGWAGGAQSNGPENQESSSESMNFSCGMFQWGAETGNRELRDLGLCLWVTERTAIDEYWFDVRGEVFPRDKGFQPPCVGQVWGGSANFANYWGGSVNETVGINMIPNNRGSLYLGLHPEYLRQKLDWMDAHQATHDVWFDNFVMIRAMCDPATAIAKFNEKTNQHPSRLSLYGAGYGMSDDPATTYHWLHNLNQLGRVDPTVVADSPHYQVFVDATGRLRTYIVYNADKNAPRTITFADGLKIMDVPPGQMAIVALPINPPASSA